MSNPSEPVREDQKTWQGATEATLTDGNYRNRDHGPSASNGCAQRFTVEGDPSDVIALAEAEGWKITHPRWWQRTYAVPRWVVWAVIPGFTIQAIKGLYLIVGWLS